MQYAEKKSWLWGLVCVAAEYAFILFCMFFPDDAIPGVELEAQFYVVAVVTILFATIGFVKYGYYSGWWGGKYPVGGVREESADA